jgi:predicted aspartyl protease
MSEVRATVKVNNPLKVDGVVLELDACVDTGAVMLLVGRNLAERLELPMMGRAIVTRADDSCQEMDKAGPVYLELGDRTNYFSCLVGQIGCEPLIGQLVLEALDLVVDRSRRSVRPRPDSPAYPSYKMK